MWRYYNISNGLFATILKVIFAISLCCLIVFSGINNVYTRSYAIFAIVGAVIAVVLLIVYSFVDGKECLRKIAYILFAISYIVCMVILIFVSEYDEPYIQKGRYHSLRSNYAAKIDCDIREGLSVDKIFDFDSSISPKEVEDNYNAHIITFFERYDINGIFRSKYISDDGEINVSQEYLYYDRIIRDSNKDEHSDWLKSKFLSGTELGYVYNFSENDYITGEKDGIQYQYMCKHLSGNVLYFIVYMQDDDTFFVVNIRIKSPSRLNFDKEKVMENVLSAVNESGIMKTV